MPINKVVRRQGADSVPHVRRYPDIRGGICERCGVINQYLENYDQYKLCEHYRTLGEMRCTYCPNDNNHHPDEVARRSVLKVFDDPDNASGLIVVCDEYNCSRLHEERYKKNA